MYLAQKLELRKKFRAISLAPDLEKIKSSRLIRRAEAIFDKHESILAFRALPGEPDLTSLFEKNWSRFGFTKVQNENLDFYTVESDDFELGEFSIKEPAIKNAKRRAIADFSLALIPGIAFDRRGARLGRGKGFYDRALSEYKGIKVGICFTNRISEEEIPVENHDVLMDFLLTEDFILQPVRKGN